MSAAWLSYPLAFTGMRMFECGDLSTEECEWYKARWHFWYIADYVFALPTIAFFTCVIGLFVIGHAVSTMLLRRRKLLNNSPNVKAVAMVRYMSYRGFRLDRFNWNSAPVGVLALGALGTIFFFCMVLAPRPFYWPDEKFGGSPPLATRSGWLALGCMPFVFATASKTNWITLVTGVSHERLQVFHRWISYAFFILALLHTFPFIVYHIHWHDMRTHIAESLLFYWTGVVALIAQAWLTFMSHSTIRRFGYEFFKMSHFAAILVFMITFFWHCDYTLTSWHYFLATAVIYVPCFLFPWLRTMFEYKWTQQAHLTVENNGLTRVTIPANFDWLPGQHCFLRFTSFGLLRALSSHPFTVCSLPLTGAEGLSQLVFYIRHQDGFTKTLHEFALEHPGVNIPVLVDGPYGGIRKERLTDCDHHLLIAGGSGAGWCLSLIEYLVNLKGDFSTEKQDVETQTSDEQLSHHCKRMVSHTSQPFHIRVVLATRETKSRIWFEEAVSEVLARCRVPRASTDLRVHVHVTAGPRDGDHEVGQPMEGATHDDEARSAKGVQACLDKLEEQTRPDLPTIVDSEAASASEEGASLAVYVCGPASMQNDVRNAVAMQNMRLVKEDQRQGIYLHTEHFSWA